MFPTEKKQDSDPGILIIADIEGSSGCWDRQGAAFMTRKWHDACLGMTRDIVAVSNALLRAGVKKIFVKDFHRTGYNIFPELLDPKIHLISGYKHGDVPGFGALPRVDGAMFLGMHAASGSGGFLAHTLTSRVKKLIVNGELCCELQLFAASLAPHGIRPLFFSGCPEACRQAKRAIPAIRYFPIDKSGGKKNFDAVSWREKLAMEAAASLNNRDVKPYYPPGPFKATMTMRHGNDAARKIAARWGLAHRGADIFFEAKSPGELYETLLRACYLTPLTRRLLPAGILRLYNLFGWMGHEVARGLFSPQP